MMKQASAQRTLTSMFKRLLPTSALALWCISATAPAQSLIDPRYGNSEHADGAVSLDQAVAMVQGRFHAKAVKAETAYEDGRPVHYIRLVSADKSRVWTVRVDGATGRIY
jgi:uncharacterized membrane protein YkoI